MGAARNLANSVATLAPVMPELPELAPVVVTSGAPSIETPAPVEPLPIAAPIVRPAYEQDAEKRAIEFQAALDAMAELGRASSKGAASLTNAGIEATRLVWEKVVNDSHVEALYAEFAKGHNELAKGGDTMNGADKSALSRFRTFFRTEVAVFVYGSGANHNWHDTVADIRASITADERKGSLYNGLVDFNRRVCDLGADVGKLDEDMVRAMLTKEASTAKTVEDLLNSLLDAAKKCAKKTNAPEMDVRIVEVLRAYIHDVPLNVKVLKV